MKTITLELPTLYGDHHVLEVRKILLDIPGVENVYASSCFQIVEVSYDEAKTNDLEISMKLDEAGYLGEWSVPMETGAAAYNETSDRPFFRHTAIFEQSKQVVGFSQNVAYTGRPLWTCPGFGVIKNKMED